MGLKQSPSEFDGLFEQVTITLPGPIPSKKNKLRPRMGGGRGQMYDPQTKGQIDALVTQARIQWGDRLPLTSPQVFFGLEYVDGSQDRDGIWTTILDALKKAGIIVDDSIKSFNGTLIHTPARLAAAQLAIVKVCFETGKADKRSSRPVKKWRKVRSRRKREQAEACLQTMLFARRAC